MGSVTELELLKARDAVAEALSLSHHDANDYLNIVCDLTWGMRWGLPVTWSVTDDAERLIKAFAGPNGVTLVKVHQARKS